MENYNHFELFIILNLIIIGTYLLTTWIASFSLKRVYGKVMKLVFDLPPIKKYLMSEVEKNRMASLKTYPKELLIENRKIPYKPPSIELGDASEK